MAEVSARQRQRRRRGPVPSDQLDLESAARMLKVSVPTVRRRLYAGDLRAVNRRSDTGVLLDRQEVEQLAARIASGEVPADKRRLNGKQGRKPSTPVALRQAPADEAASAMREAVVEPAVRPVAPVSDGLSRRPWRS